jgi:hypothetical protein
VTIPVGSFEIADVPAGLSSENTGIGRNSDRDCLSWVMPTILRHKGAENLCQMAYSRRIA